MKLPFTFGIQLVYRLLLPGYIVALFAYPLLLKFEKEFVVGFTPVLAINLIALFAGWLFVIFDMHIYMLLEGRRYWPHWLFKLCLLRQQARVDTLYRKLEQAKNDQQDFTKSNVQRSLARRIELEASVRLRWYPVDENGRFYASMPTSFGNALDAYETYPKDMYGMPAMFYWPRLWLLIGDDERHEVDNQQAIVDGAAYATVALWLATILTIASGIIADWRNYLVAGFLLIVSWIVYRGSLYAHAQFGQIFKAVFDVYRSRLPDLEWAEVIFEDLERLNDIGTIDLARRRSRYMNIYRWLHNRRIKVDDRVVLAAELLKRAGKS